MTDVMFDLPDVEHKSKYLVTEEVVRREQTLFGKKTNIDKKSA